MFVYKNYKIELACVWLGLVLRFSQSNLFKKEYRVMY
jgi:hypothetical protein